MPLSGCLADCGDQLRRELSQLFGDQKRIAAPANVEHPIAVQVEAGLEAIVAAQDLHRQPRGHDLGDGGRDEGLVSVLNHQLVAFSSIASTSPDGASAATFSLAPARAWAGSTSRAQARTHR